MRPLAALLLLALAAAGATPASAQPLESAVKAAFLPKFAPYVAWPRAAVPAPGTPFVICVVGRDPFGTLVDDAVREERGEASPIAVRRLDRVDRASGCHIAYLAGSAVQPVPAAIAALGNAPVLTVTDGRTGRQRGIIHFELRGGRVRFHIDDAAAARANLTLSSKLLGLALSVKPRGRA